MITVGDAYDTMVEAKEAVNRAILDFSESYRVSSNVVRKEPKTPKTKSKWMMKIN